MKVIVNRAERQAIKAAVKNALNLFATISGEEPPTDDEIVENLESAYDCKFESQLMVTTVTVEPDFVVKSFNGAGAIYKRANNVATKVRETVFSVVKEFEGLKEDLAE